MSALSRTLGELLQQHGPGRRTVKEEIRANLPRQIYSSVQWVDSVRFIASQGVTDFVEIGPGRVLFGLARKCLPSGVQPSDVSLEGWKVSRLGTPPSAATT
mgnify:CR=1 FL=1